MQTLAEDLLLLAIDDDRGTVSWSRPTAELKYGLGGALLMDLALQERIESVEKKIIAGDPAPTGDELLDAAMEMIRSVTNPQNAMHWVKKLGDQKDLKEQLAHRLVARGILRQEEHTYLWVFREPRYPTVDPEPEAAIRRQIHDVVAGHAESNPRTLLLLSLVNACDLTDGLFTDGERKQAKRRIKELVESEQIGKAVDKAVAEVVVATMAAVTAAVFSTTVASGAHA
jgi:Golgi phosphoprotein 3